MQRERFAVRSVDRGHVQTEEHHAAVEQPCRHVVVENGERLGKRVRSFQPLVRNKRGVAVRSTRATSSMRIGSRPLTSSTRAGPRYAASGSDSAVAPESSKWYGALT